MLVLLAVLIFVPATMSAFVKFLRTGEARYIGETVGCAIMTVAVVSGDVSGFVVGIIVAVVTSAL
jgi:hypothetical protein